MPKILHSLLPKSLHFWLPFTRIAFKTRTRVDSRTILDTYGAEELPGYGYMLLLYNDELTRLKGVFTDTL